MASIMLRKILSEIDDDYRSQHTAPSKEDSPMYDLSNTYPDDIYSSDAVRLYGDGSAYDWDSMSTIQSAKGKPNMRVKIYRAVPDVNFDASAVIKKYKDLTSYFQKYGFLPVGVDLKDDPDIEAVRYDRDKILPLLSGKIKELESGLKSGHGIEPGDWVTISRPYAKEHGDYNLNRKYKIVSKMVRARDLYTDGNSIHEWGYNP